MQAHLVQAALWVERSQLDAPVVNIVPDAVHKDVEPLLLEDLQELLAEHHETLAGLKDLLLLGGGVVVREADRGCEGREREGGGRGGSRVS